jgi:hypothetical protein
MTTKQGCTMKTRARNSPQPVSKPVEKMTPTEIALAFCTECRGCKHAAIDHRNFVCASTKSGAYLLFHPSKLDEVMEAVREWLSSMDAYESEENFADVLHFSFEAYFAGVLDQSEVGCDLMAACLQANRGQKQDASATEKPIDKMKLAEIADELLRRMRELENHPTNRPTDNARRIFFYTPNATVAGRYISGRYNASQMPFGEYSLSKDQAGRYLDWLRAGNIGTHHEAKL